MVDLTPDEGHGCGGFARIGVIQLGGPCRDVRRDGDVSRSVAPPGTSQPSSPRSDTPRSNGPRPGDRRSRPHPGPAMRRSPVADTRSAGPLSQTALLRSLAVQSVRTVRRARQLPMRVVVVMAVTLGAVVLLGATGRVAGSDDDAPGDGGSGADCPWLTDRVTDLSAAQERNAKIITVVARAYRLGDTGATIAVAAALAESNLLNLANDGTSTLTGSLQGRQLTDNERAMVRRSMNHPHDEVGNNLDSIGLFQQRPTAGWGPPEILIDPERSAELFFDHLVQVPGWRTMTPWDSAQAVQSSPSSDGEIYRRSYEQALGIVADVSGTLPNGSSLPPPPGVTSNGLCAVSAT